MYGGGHEKFTVPRPAVKVLVRVPGRAAAVLPAVQRVDRRAGPVPGRELPVLSREPPAMKTEEEARKCWCPFARTVERAAAGSSNARNRVVAVGPEDATKTDEERITAELVAGLMGCQCIASDCMAWRAAVGVYDRQESRFLGPNESWSSSARYEERFNGRGFCGLAGQL